MVMPVFSSSYCVDCVPPPAKFMISCVILLNAIATLALLNHMFKWNSTDSLIKHILDWRFNALEFTFVTTALISDALALFMYLAFLIANLL